jgi:hypothetical protein
MPDKATEVMLEMSEEDKKRMHEQYEDILKNASSQISFHHPFWASILLALGFVWEPNRFHTMATDGIHLFVDPIPNPRLLNSKDNII